MRQFRRYLIKNVKDIHFLFFYFEDLLKFVDWNLEKYRKKLHHLFNNQCFFNWDANDMIESNVNVSYAMQKTKTRTF
jgi:hypothetical protein